MPSDGSPPTLSTPRVGTARPDSERGCPIMERTRTVYGLPARQARKEVAVPTSRTPSLLGVVHQQIDAGSEPEPPKMERTSLEGNGHLGNHAISPDIFIGSDACRPSKRRSGAKAHSQPILFSAAKAHTLCVWIRLDCGLPFAHCPEIPRVANYHATFEHAFMKINGRIAEIATSGSLVIILGYEAGYLPPRPPFVSSTFSVVNGTGNFTVQAGLNPNHAISFAQPITYPPGATPEAGWPLVIVYDALSIPVPDGIAVMVYTNDNIAQQNGPSSRGIGLFYDLYGANATASAMTAWVWGVSRIIDALEITPEANINRAKIAVTGCSRDGKGALMAGAFEPRIALTIPQESGSGGDTCWRLSKYEQDSGDIVQQATEIVTENVWFSVSFDNYVYNIRELPYDHHELAAMVAPRPMISYENTELEWLSPLSGFGCMTAAHAVYEALGIAENHGFVQVGNHSHCYFPDTLNASLFAFFEKFLLDREDVSTDYFYTNYMFNGTVWDPSHWINWTIPQLN
ncbi:hypothetical protein IEO21_08650 [Rhodonia placenta]|uniref:(4-O-methyl)-D-glucuronate--lignin esterase n=1 Tax=Rhodonia placenta TaxID=104341 RepID=A0A8H7NVQ2_9APHY|nr:hypothetical protein IEO21_08650 [Postia placenta]